MRRGNVHIFNIPVCLFSSFGHHCAKSYGIADGYKTKENVQEQIKVKLGFAITRQSVLKVFYICAVFLISDHWTHEL